MEMVRSVPPSELLEPSTSENGKIRERGAPWGGPGSDPPSTSAVTDPCPGRRGGEDLQQESGRQHWEIPRHHQPHTQGGRLVPAPLRSQGRSPGSPGQLNAGAARGLCTHVWHRAIAGPREPLDREDCFPVCWLHPPPLSRPVSPPPFRSNSRPLRPSSWTPKLWPGTAKRSRSSRSKCSPPVNARLPGPPHLPSCPLSPTSPRLQRARPPPAMLQGSLSLNPQAPGSPSPTL